MRLKAEKLIDEGETFRPIDSDEDSQKSRKSLGIGKYDNLVKAVKKMKCKKVKENKYKTMRIQQEKEKKEKDDLLRDPDDFTPAMMAKKIEENS